jgi:hypothetical protein
MNEQANTELRPYVAGADVMTTWHRCTGWIPPSRDPRYIAKWLNFQLDILDSRRRAIEAQFALNFMKGTMDEERPKSTDGAGKPANVLDRRGSLCTSLHGETSLGQSWHGPRHGQDHHAVDGTRSKNEDDALMAAALDAVAQSCAISDDKTTTQ